MPLVTVQELIDAGVHYGHQASRWNPKMKPYIHGKRHKIHIIDLKETIRGLYSACHFLRSIAAVGGQVLFLGTKRQVRPVVEAQAARCGMPAVTERWIGGTLTNFNTVRERLTRLEQLEAMEADGTMEKHKKKAQSKLRREMRKISRNLEGVRMLNGLPAAMVVVDPRREENAVREATRMNVPVVCILDTDCDPSVGDIVIPANDDAMSSVQLLMVRLADAVMEGRSGVDEEILLQAQKAAKDDVRAKQVMGRTREVGGPRRGGGGPGGRGRRPAGAPGGSLGVPARGRFAHQQASVHADSVSLGESKEDKATPEEVKEIAKTEGPGQEAPATAPAEPKAEAPPPAPVEPKPEAPAPAPTEPKPEDKPATDA